MALNYFPELTLLARSQVSVKFAEKNPYCRNTKIFSLQPLKARQRSWSTRDQCEENSCPGYR